MYAVGIVVVPPKHTCQSPPGGGIIQVSVGIVPTRGKLIYVNALGVPAPGAFFELCKNTVDFLSQLVYNNSERTLPENARVI